MSVGNTVSFVSKPGGHRTATRNAVEEASMGQSLSDRSGGRLSEVAGEESPDSGPGAATSGSFKSSLLSFAVAPSPPLTVSLSQHFCHVYLELSKSSLSIFFAFSSGIELALNRSV